MVNMLLKYMETIKQEPLKNRALLSHSISKIQKELILVTMSCKQCFLMLEFMYVQDASATQVHAIKVLEFLRKESLKLQKAG